MVAQLLLLTNNWQWHLWTSVFLMTRCGLSPLLQEGHPCQTSDNCLVMEAVPLGEAEAPHSSVFLLQIVKFPTSHFSDHTVYMVLMLMINMSGDTLNFAFGHRKRFALCGLGNAPSWVTVSDDSYFFCFLEGLRSFLWSAREQRGICLFRLDCATWFKGRCAHFSQ